MGTGLTQNSDSTLIHYVTEGKLRPNQGTRGVGNPGKVSLHVDLADVVSLLCVRQPEDSPPSRLASSLTIHNLIRERAPHLLPRFYQGFPWDRQGEHDPRETPTTGYRVPVFSAADGVVSCRYNRSWMAKAADRNGGFSPEDRELLDLFDDLAAECTFEFPFNPGDIQFANNYTTLHGRAPHAAVADAHLDQYRGFSPLRRRRHHPQRHHPPRAPGLDSGTVGRRPGWQDAPAPRVGRGARLKFPHLRITRKGRPQIGSRPSFSLPARAGAFMRPRA